MQQKPSIGRVVHYVEHGTHYAATVTAVHSDSCVNLAVFGYRPATQDEATGEVTFGQARPTVLVISSMQDETQQAHASWHWPEREPASEGKAPEPDAKQPRAESSTVGVVDIAPDKPRTMTKAEKKAAAKAAGH